MVSVGSTAFVFLLLGALALTAVVGIRLVLKRRNPEGKSDSSLPRCFPEAIHIGSDLANPMVTLRPLPLAEQQRLESVPITAMSSGVATQISTLMQAVPSLLVAEAHHGRQLMEVVINGQLVRAADGNGFRAMAMGPNGINEHARLYEAKDLSTLVNAAAVWQLASVVVAQKHMADISQKLSELRAGVDSIRDFLADGRRSTIRGAYQYLQQAYAAVAMGELSAPVRGELETCEMNLLAMQDHLTADCRRQTQDVPKDDDRFGTESLHKNGVAKYRELGRTVSDLALCLRTRVLCWYVLSLYPGEQYLKAARRDDIEQGLKEFEALQQMARSQSRNDVEGFKSMWNLSDTLSSRKSDVLREAGEVQSQLEAVRSDTLEQLERTQQLLLERDSPTQLIVELLDGVVTQVRQRELAAA